MASPHNTRAVPEEWICPITYQLMRDPVIAPDTRTYERTNIETWLSVHGTSPFTRQKMDTSELIPNKAIRDMIEAKFGEHAPTTTHEEDDTRVIYCLVDRSGSMSMGIDTPGYEQDGFSRLDLVKHSIRTIIHSLTTSYSLGIVSFSQSARMDLTPVKMNSSGKALAIRSIENIHPESTTNIWDGIRLIMSMHTRGDTPLIILFTDGQSNVTPPRGIHTTLTRSIETSGINPIIHTIGFGYDIDSELLHSIADSTNGLFGFIPDCTMIGSVFVNIIAYIMSHEHETAYEPAWPEIVKYLSVFADNSHRFDVDIEKYRIGRLIDTLTLRYTNNDKLRNLCSDIQDSSKDKGQIEKAVSSKKWFSAWGKHYLLSLHLAHKKCVCINFKDASLQDYKTSAFETVQDVVETVFINLPSPEPSDLRVRNAIRSGHITSTPMSVYYNASSGCFTGDTLIRVCDMRSYKVLPDESARFRPVKYLKPGDWVVSNHNQSAKIRFVTKFINHNSLITRLSDTLSLSAYHPVRRYKTESIMNRSKWEFPCEIAGSSLETHDLYNLVLENSSTGETMGVVYTPSHECVVFGHGIHTDNVVSHGYFGTKSVVDDIAEEDHKQGNDGIITVNILHEVRDPSDGKIIKYIFNQ